MNKWSDNLIKISREYLYYSGTCVKSIKGEFGELDIDYENSIYYIRIRNSEITLTFKSVDEIINSGWVVD